MSRGPFAATGVRCGQLRAHGRPGCRAGVFAAGGPPPAERAGGAPRAISSRARSRPQSTTSESPAPRPCRARRPFGRLQRDARSVRRSRLCPPAGDRLARRYSSSPSGTNTPTNGRPSSSMTVVTASSTGRVHRGANRAGLRRAQRHRSRIVRPDQSVGCGDGVVHGISPSRVWCDFGVGDTSHRTDGVQRQNARRRTGRAAARGGFAARCAARCAAGGR